MIYFRISSSFDISELKNLKDNNFDTIKSLSHTILLKVGYCDDDPENSNKRFQIYKTENPGMIDYKRILGGTKEDEFGIIEKFKSKRVVGREWFILDQELFDFIERVNTLEELREEIKYNTGRYNLLRKDIKRDIHITSLWIESILDLLNFEINDWLEDRKYIEKCLIDLDIDLTKEDKTFELVSSYFDIDFKQLKDKICNNVIKNPKVTEFANTFNQTSNTVVKLKMLVNFGKLGDIDKDDMNNLFNLVQPKYRDYYTILGPSKIKMLGYQESKIKDELERLINNVGMINIIRDEIYKTFLVGKRYTNVSIKETLKAIYLKIGYQKSPKATDLNEYFEVKRIMTPNKENGFEILSRK